VAFHTSAPFTRPACILLHIFGTCSRVPSPIILHNPHPMHALATLYKVVEDSSTWNSHSSFLKQQRSALGSSWHTKMLSGNDRISRNVTLFSNESVHVATDDIDVYRSTPPCIHFTLHLHLVTLYQHPASKGDDETIVSPSMDGTQANAVRCVWSCGAALDNSN